MWYTAFPESSRPCNHSEGPSPGQEDSAASSSVCIGGRCPLLRGFEAPELQACCRTGTFARDPDGREPPWTLWRPFLYKTALQHTGETLVVGRHVLRRPLLCEDLSGVCGCIRGGVDRHTLLYTRSQSNGPFKYGGLISWSYLVQRRGISTPLSPKTSSQSGQWFSLLQTRRQCDWLNCLWKKLYRSVESQRHSYPTVGPVCSPTLCWTSVSSWERRN